PVMTHLSVPLSSDLAPTHAKNTRRVIRVRTRSILEVFFLGYCAQVVRSHAAAIPADVIYPHPRRNVTIRNLVGVPVRSYRPPLTSTEVSVTLLLKGASPQPAVARLINLRPKTFLGRDTLRHVELQSSSATPRDS